MPQTQRLSAELTYKIMNGTNMILFIKTQNIKLQGILLETRARKSSFVRTQGIDSSAAFQRMTITKRTLEEYQAEINATNTADVVGNLARLYDDLEILAKAIIREEQLLISLGE